MPEAQKIFSQYHLLPLTTGPHMSISWFLSPKCRATGPHLQEPVRIGVMSDDSGPTAGAGDVAEAWCCPPKGHQPTFQDHAVWEANTEVHERVRSDSTGVPVVTPRVDAKISLYSKAGKPQAARGAPVLSPKRLGGPRTFSWTSTTTLRSWTSA